MISVNMLSKADSVKGHGVLTAHDEQVSLVADCLSDNFQVYENLSFSCDINHFHTINIGYFLRLPFLKSSGITVGYVHFLPETVEKSLRLPFGIKELFYKYMIKFYNSMDYLVTVNPNFIDKLCSYGIKRDKITYIPNYVSKDRFFKLDRCDKNAIKERFGIEKDKFTVLSVGQLQKRKGVLEFIELAKSMPELSFVWAGGFSFGKMSDGYDDIKSAMENPPSNVKFIGLVDHSEMNLLYNMADVMFQPSFEELFPMTILEAMSCELPMLLRDLEEYKPILHGYYLKGNNTNEFRQQLKNLMQADFYDNACVISKTGSAFYSREKVAQMWKKFYLSAYNECLSSYKTKIHRKTI